MERQEGRRQTILTRWCGRWGKRKRGEGGGEEAATVTVRRRRRRRVSMAAVFGDLAHEIAIQLTCSIA